KDRFLLLPVYGEVAPKAPEGQGQGQDRPGGQGQGQDRLLPVYGEVAPKAPEGQAPLLLYGYGAYELSNDPMFDPARLSLLDRGFAFAIALVRGGGEMGREWYEDGKLLR